MLISDKHTFFHLAKNFSWIWLHSYCVRVMQILSDKMAAPWTGNQNKWSLSASTAVFFCQITCLQNEMWTFKFFLFHTVYRNSLWRGYCMILKLINWSFFALHMKISFLKNKSVRPLQCIWCLNMILVMFSFFHVSYAVDHVGQSDWGSRRRNIQQSHPKPGLHIDLSYTPVKFYVCMLLWLNHVDKIQPGVTAGHEKVT